MAGQVKTVAILAARPGKASKLRALLESMLEPSRAEAGNLHYELWQDQADPDRFVLDELYADKEAVEAHRATRHFQTYLAAIHALAERTTLMLTPAAVA